MSTAVVVESYGGPVTRADEMFTAMTWWAPLFDPHDADPLLREVDVPRRARILADAYGLSDLTAQCTIRSLASGRRGARRGRQIRSWNAASATVVTPDSRAAR